MLGIPVELYTPIFAIARIVGWSAHRMEELVNVDKIIRPTKHHADKGVCAAGGEIKRKKKFSHRAKVLSAVL